MRLAAAHSLRSHVCGPSLPSTGRKTCGSAGRKCPHTASKPLRIHKVFSAAFSLSASISAPAELLRIGQPWIFEGFLFFWTQAGCRPPRRKGQKAPKGLAVRRMGFLPVDGLFSPTHMSPEKMVKTLFAPAGANSARLFRQAEGTGLNLPVPFFNEKKISSKRGVRLRGRSRAPPLRVQFGSSCRGGDLLRPIK